MRMRTLVPAFGAIALIGCQAADEPNAATNAAVSDDAEGKVVGNASADNALAAVLGMTDRQRNVVFIRALLDADIPCQGVDSSTRLPDQDGKPLWRVNCQGGTAHMIGVTPDGTANIVSRTDR
ncbi:hypothetical protein [Sphingomonas sp. M1-B02]|uniref:hypothetical protein n=1 Tax=Sphingomonas sp. M1-B02 TaxID=3114300 RepID=UPI00223FEB04|nr:hypothetical protein [Sphingomonas sp. S6-11]UZK67478.1 hypothetical protein OKW87_06500 [Sphingomonas sp. S6-11]